MNDIRMTLRSVAPDTGLNDDQEVSSYFVFRVQCSLWLTIIRSSDVQKEYRDAAAKKKKKAEEKKAAVKRKNGQSQAPSASASASSSSSSSSSAAAAPAAASASAHAGDSTDVSLTVSSALYVILYIAETDTCLRSCVCMYVGTPPSEAWQTKLSLHLDS
jgi:hypothetical protein